MPLNQALLPEFDHEMGNTRKSLERIPEGKFDWKPHQKSASLGQLATHLATINHWTEAIIGQDSFDVANSPRPSQFKSRQEVLNAFDQGTAAARKAIAGATDEQFMEALVARKRRTDHFYSSASRCSPELYSQPHDSSSGAVGRLPEVE